MSGTILSTNVFSVAFSCLCFLALLREDTPACASRGRPSKLSMEAASVLVDGE